jgi:hypothetical protein
MKFEIDWDENAGISGSKNYFLKIKKDSYKVIKLCSYPVIFWL